MSWTPSSWRGKPARQLPAYPDSRALAMAESRLAEAAPLAPFAESRLLSARLAEVASGKGFLLQGGDCAETFAEFGADRVRRSFTLLLQMAAMIGEAPIGETGIGEVVKVARLAGQFAKPRSAATETIDGVTLPSWRGDIVNGAGFDAASRTPDPARMLEAHHQSEVTLDLLRAFGAAAYADLPDMHRAARRRLGLAEHEDPVEPAETFTSHEALLLNYEEALTRRDEATGDWWATSAHMIWIGERTRQLDGAHVDFASGIANTIGLKCGPTLTPDELLRLIDRLDPGNRAGRVVLIGRFGAQDVVKRLPALMRATRAAGSRALWSIDPMHGNTRTVAGRKTRTLPDILAELRAFFEIAAVEGVHPGGVHLEMTGEEVTECLGGTRGLREEDLGRRYLTHCDPRLNGAQALDVAAEVTRLLRDGARAASDAA